jgi:NADH-quinone oxidoreductase subunit C
MNTAELVGQIKVIFGEKMLSESSFMQETTVEVSKEGLKEVLAFLKGSPGPGYEVLMDLTGVDYLFPFPRTKVIYWLHNPSTLERLRIIVFVGREESLPSVVELWGGADWYERELYDMFGIRFENHPELTRILMPDDWEGHPMRRDYPLTEVPVQFKHGVHPKVPSKIISYEKSKQRAS